MSGQPGGGGAAPFAPSALIAAIAARGDRAAFEALFAYFAPRVKAYGLRLGLPPELAEELAQETMLIVWRRAAAFDPDRAAASTWIFTIARNQRIDLARRKTRQTRAEDGGDEADPVATPHALLAATQDVARVGAAVAALPMEQREVIRMAYFSDEPHARISEALGLPLGTVKSRLRLAMARLKASLGDMA